MKRRRIFIAINLPEKIKEELCDYSKKWPEFPCRWTKKENLHLTLFFLGYLKEEQLTFLSQAVRKAVGKFQPFFLKITKIIYAPPGKKMPRMIWAEVEKNKYLQELWQKIKASIEKEVLGPDKESNRFSPHITLARIKQWEFKRLLPEERPDIEKELSLSFEVKSIEIMESKLKPKGPDYFVLESVKLGLSEEK